jgi:flavorubredoxin
MRTEVFKAVQVSDHVYWVGAIDRSIRDFHGYSTNRGTTYNAYLILADNITLIDTVKAPFKDEMLSRIALVVDPSEISVIISNHSEMDHSGCLPWVIDLVKPEQVIASVMGVKALSRHFHFDQEIKDGETLNLGNMDITFMETRMLHWPDSMFSYLSGERVLFSQDGFGMHLASYRRFADEIEDSILEYEAGKYFANILLPYAGLIPKTFEKVKKAHIDPVVIAPDHGPIWRNADDINRILGFYASWAEQKPTLKAVIVFDTMWQSTERMARAISEGLAQENVRVSFMPLRGVHRSDVVAEILDAGALIVGSPTINNTVFPTVADIMSYIKGLRPKILLGAAFGSYGWSGEAVKQLEAMLTDMKLELAAESMAVQYVPDEKALAQCYNLGRKVAEKLKNYVQNF